MRLKFNLHSSRTFASALMLSVALAGCASGPNSPSPELAQRIEAARTRSDHEGLGTYYKQEGATARTKAAEHRKMAKAYEGRVVDPRDGGRLPAHCNAIVNMYERIAMEYDGLAESHQQMAKQAQN